MTGDRFQGASLPFGRWGPGESEVSPVALKAAGSTGGTPCLRKQVTTVSRGIERGGRPLLKMRR